MTSPASASTTPMFQQYHRAKAEHQDAILMFRMGDFYEMFFDDATLASELLEITLTSRGPGAGGREPIPMCGVPVHAVDGYIARLVDAGHQVAICEQVEDARKAKGLVRREVVRVITPGTVTDPDSLDAKDHCYLASVWSDEGGLGVAYADLSAGDFQVAELDGERRWEALADQLAAFSPRELLVPEGSGLAERLPRGCGVVRSHAAWAFDAETAAATLAAQMGTASLEGFGVAQRLRAVRAGGALIHYLRQTQKDDLKHIHTVTLQQDADHMLLDAATLRNLEVVRAAADGRKTGSLLGVIDETRTAMGGRLLKSWLLRPLRDLEAVRLRHGAVGELLERGAEREEIRAALAGVADLERLLCRVTMGSAHPRDLGGLRDSFSRLPALGAVLERLSCPLAVRLGGELDTLEDLGELLGAALAERPPVALREGGILRDGYREDVDELRALGQDARAFLAGLESRERERTGIGSLKVRYNKVFGYYIEVSKPNLPSVPDDYVRKQTLVNHERFITPELKEYEAKILTAKDRLVELEHEIFLGLRDEVAAAAERIRSSAAVVASLDVLAGLAECAARRGYSRPEMHQDRGMEIRDGRHPVVEALAGEERFVPNDTLLDAGERQVLILTGPNMGGKSTFLRQTALISILAQSGSFVPARSARLPVLDRVFSRVGASDNLAGGQSTFMVEMQETANILHNATDDSLVVLDEIGRGTSTFDGLSLAWAVVEQLHDGETGRPLTLFATHYHELTELEVTLQRVFNQNIAVREWNDDIVFLRKVVDGAADQSYGIHVARLAGIPKAVIARAREVLENLETAEFTREGLPRLARTRDGEGPEPPAQMSLFVPKDPALEEVRARLLELDPDQLTPMDALRILGELRARLRDASSD